MLVPACRSFTAVGIGCCLVACLVGCTGDPPLAPKPPEEKRGAPFRVNIPAESLPSPAANRPLEAAPICPSFDDVAAERGLQHIYKSGASGKALMVETMGGGVGWLDFDGDGLWDIYLNDGGIPDSKDLSQNPPDRLFRNLGDSFQEVALKAGIIEHRYGQGVAIGDYDSDGFDDIYLTNVGRNTLYRNMGDGTFCDVTEEAGVGDVRWSTSAAWADLTGDGLLDLYVCNYTVYDAHNPIPCKDKSGRLRICHPRDVPAAPDECYINQGDGTFLPRAKEMGLFGPGNKALGVAVADFDNNGLPDIYVANDTEANFLFINQGDGTFRESALLLGCALDRNGARQASMGLAVADYDGNGYLDIYSTHYQLESNTLYRNLGPHGFQDVTALVGLHEPTLPVLAFGNVMADFANDGRMQVFITNGHIDALETSYAMPPQLFAFDGKRWSECQPQTPYFAGKYVGRGVASGDFNNDGALDLAIAHQDTPAALLQNQTAGGNWLKLSFRGSQSNRRGIGVRVEMTAGKKTWMQELVGGSSYCSSHQSMLIFGLGDYSAPVNVKIRWPSGIVQELQTVTPNQAIVVFEPASPKPASAGSG